MMKKVDFDLYANEYDQIVSDQTKFFADDYNYFAEYKVILLREFVQGHVVRILEYGCGTGRNINYFSKYFTGSEVVGADLSHKSLEIAKSNNINTRFELIDDYFFDRIGYFDLIFIAGVFHHVAPDLRSTLSFQIAKLLKKGGKIIVFEHNPNNPVTRKLVRDCPFDTDAVLIGMQDLIKLLINSDLHLKSSGYTLFFPPKFNQLLRLEKYMRWIPFGGQYFIVLESS